VDRLFIEAAFHRSGFSSQRLFIEAAFHWSGFSSKQLFIEAAFHWSGFSSKQLFIEAPYSGIFERWLLKVAPLVSAITFDPVGRGKFCLQFWKAGEILHVW
jgi:hypothetical protein